ncbi:MAG: glutamate-1-semialdehyde-2,1-aminomutase [Candidatus Omnitrophica bacterium CG07_land_8_20_14_0_80_50_8]|nr:MAG: glutamate-1-semialdehyde-2,1-aminomutase [Candidatus Omnitrophica bacterium CG07_land_8_20_14_0_80_50_8]
MARPFKRSKTLSSKNTAWAEAQKHLAGGVNSPVLSFKSVGGDPVFMKRGLGPCLYDIRGQKYIDYCLSWGAILLGHADPQTVQSIQSQAAKGTSFGTVTEYETALAIEIKRAFPAMERIRFTSSGTEAAMSAIRLARGVTKRDRILKFEGCYHGHGDSLLVKAGSGLATFGSPDSRGVPKDIARWTSVLPYNDSGAVIDFFKKEKKIACVIVEPIAANMGVVPAKKEFLEVLRKETKKNGALLIFDEVISGFRVCFGGAQHVYGIEPDITLLGKIIGGGLPVGAFGARSGLMSALSPSGKVYQAGTLSGNPLSMASGKSVLSRLSKPFYEKMRQKTSQFLEEARGIFMKRKVSAVIQDVGSMFTIFFTPRPVVNFKDARSSDQRLFKTFFHGMLAEGVYLPPSAFETLFVSAAHGDRDFQKTLKALKTVCF